MAKGRSTGTASHKSVCKRKAGVELSLLPSRNSILLCDLSGSFCIFCASMNALQSAKRLRRSEEVVGIQPQGCGAHNGTMPSSSFGRAPPMLQLAGIGKETQGCFWSRVKAAVVDSCHPCFCTGTHLWAARGWLRLHRS